MKEIELNVGDIVMGRYEIVCLLGSGVFARVIKAKDLLSPT